MIIEINTLRETVVSIYLFNLHHRGTLICQSKLCVSHECSTDSLYSVEEEEEETTIITH
jgi:hypothetical protein